MEYGPRSHATKPGGKCQKGMRGEKIYGREKGEGTVEEKDLLSQQLIMDLSRYLNTSSEE